MGEDQSAVDAQVTDANRAFYRAFSDGDLDAMEAVWSHGAHVRCVHPGWTMIEGWERVRESWARILSGPDGELDIAIDAVQVRAAGGIAWVACLERLSTGDFASVMVVTNVFERGDDGAWRMVQHHASPVLRDASDPDGTGGAQGGDVN